MVDSLPNVPGNRMAIDSDGTKMFSSWSGNPDVLTDQTDQIPVLNDERATTFWNIGSGNVSQTFTVSLVFPEHRDVFGYYLNVYRPSISGAVYDFSGVYGSPDTTTGKDGTWEQWISADDQVMVDTHAWRTGIQSVSQPGVKGVQVRYARNSDNSGTQFRVHRLHLYGETPAAENPDSLRIVHPTLDQRVSGSYFDWGDLILGQVESKTFRVQNQSSDLTAQTVSLSLQDPSGYGLASGLEFTLDGTTWSTTLGLGDLAPGQISPLVTVRLTVPLALGPLLPYAARIRATAATWV